MKSGTAEPGGRDDDRRGAVLDAAGAVFLDVGFQAATTAEIARRARVSKRTIYELFGSKAGLLDALIRASTDRMTAPLDLPAPDGPAAFRAMLTAFGTRLLEELVDPARIGLYRLAIAEAGPDRAIGRHLDDSGRRPVMDASGRLFAAAETAGLVPAGEAGPVPTAFLKKLMGARQLCLLLGTAETAGLVPVGEAGLVQAAFLNMLMGPLQLWLLLGTVETPGPDAIAARVAAAIRVVERLCGRTGG